MGSIFALQVANSGYTTSVGSCQKILRVSDILSEYRETFKPAGLKRFHFFRTFV